MTPHETTTAALGLGERGITNTCKEQLADQEKKYNERSFVANGTFSVDTGKFTGCSPKDTLIVKQPPSEDNVGWGPMNHLTTAEVLDVLYDKAIKHFSSLDRMHVLDGYCGSRLKVRIITELAWQHHFVTNTFIRPEYSSLAKKFHLDFTVINACDIVDEDWKAHGLNSEVFVIF
ncbi:hypothetical protein PsorP6_017163 [Peronosclerospora sorghi]|uniref:Uncharacterized protein n=1 Tax=Peronosclerospora sorghi TaxID=230839 RepID=A0ACC0WEE0_9STRA|nr:hypothetical protein PsorP6_017163 [Peronosclerospora sorghi]